MASLDASPDASPDASSDEEQPVPGMSEGDMEEHLKVARGSLAQKSNRRRNDQMIGWLS